MADPQTLPWKGEQMTDDEMTDATTAPILRIYTVIETDRGGVWAFEPFAMTHCVFVEESNYYIERSRATALQAERDAALARVAELEDALAALKGGK